MTAKKMHEGEVDIDAALVRRLLGSQVPKYSALPLHVVQSTGTVNVLFRLGDDLCVRLPRVKQWATHLKRELKWLPKLAPHLGLAIPQPVAKGEPENDYPFDWAIYRWLPGETFATDRVDERRAAVDLAAFITELRGVDTTGAPRSGRAPLHQLDTVTRDAIGSLHAVIDTDGAAKAWQRSLEAPAWEGRAVWRHCDLLTPNLLVDNGQLSAVIDFGGVGIGDPAADVIAAWSVFGPEGRAVFRDALAVDDPTWARARGYALHQALLIIPYYPETNPGFVSTAKRTVEHVLGDQS